MMPSIPEIGNRTLLDWRHADLNTNSDHLEIISDFFCGVHTFISYRKKDGLMLHLKAFSGFVESDLPIIDRQWGKMSWTPNVLSNKSKETKAITQIHSTTLLKSIVGEVHVPIIIISTEENTYQITAYQDAKLMYYRVLNTDRLEEVLYYVSAISDTFLKQAPHIYIESSNERWKVLNSIFAKYFQSTKSIHKSIADICTGLDSDKIIETNCAALVQYVAQ